MLNELKYLYDLKKNKQKTFDYANDFLAFAVDTHYKLYTQKFIIKPFHHKICDTLYKCAHRLLDDYIVIINMPPRFSKTQLITYYVLWCYLQNMAAKFIYATYSADLSLKTSREIKHALSHTYDKKKLITKTSDGLWETESLGGFLATSILGQVTGFGAGDIYASPFSGDVIIDDAQKPSDSFYEKKRDNVIKNFDETFWSRRNNLDKVPIIVIQQRVHEDDLSGYLLKSNYPKTLLKVPALDENGQSVFPERVSTETLLKYKEVNEYVFNAQQMQAPKKLTGNFFNVNNLEQISLQQFTLMKHKIKFYVRSWDLAGVNAKKQKGENQLDRDWTRGIKLAVFDDFLVIVDLASVRGLVAQNDVLIDEVAARDGWDCYNVFPLDPAVGGQHYANFLKSLPNLQGKENEFISQNDNKITRSQPTKALIAINKIKILAESDIQNTELVTWQTQFLEEMSSFPFGNHDDIVDALTQGMIYLKDKHNFADFDSIKDFYTDMAGW